MRGFSLFARKHPSACPVQVVRALENFKTALRLKLDGQPGAVAAVLDEAALRIEKA